MTPLHRQFSHELFTRFYYVPILLGGFWFGIKGGLQVSLLVTLMYLPHVWMGWGKGGVVLWDKLLEIVLLNLAGPTVGVLSDMERKQRARNYELLTLAALGEAAASVAHEMKNVVIPIRGFIRRIRKGCPGEPQCDSYLDIVERETARLENMTKDMLAFARQAPVDKEKVEIGTLFHELQEGMQGQFSDKGIKLVCRYGDGTGCVHIDRERIRQALVNILQNALDASKEGAEILLSARRNQHFLEVAVEDRGEGIAEEQLDRIFVPFFTTKSQGTGLGMAIARRIVNEHGGEIKVNSSPEEGTRISLMIPLTQ
jgi:signal transduction histidine kinase